MLLLLTAACGSSAAAAAGPPKPPFSWGTLPVFFHSSNTSGPWSDAAVRQISRFALATNEKSHAMRLPGGGQQSEEIAGPAGCRQVNTEKTGTATFFYLNSVIDWPFNFKLHGLMERNPAWRLKNRSGGDLGPAGGGEGVPGNNWVYNLTNDDMRAAWVATCVAAARAGCTGCFIDQANVQEGIGTWPRSSPEVLAYQKAHLAALTELDAALAPTGGYSIYNHLGVTTYGTSTMMIEDFVGNEKCIETLQTLASRGLTVEAHAGNYPDGNVCRDGDTSSLAAFLIGAGNYSYYHCSMGWGSTAKWPAEPDSWLDWLPEYDFPLGAPLGPAEKEPSPSSHASSSAKGGASLWRRAFASGTTVEFDGAANQGTIRWANGKVQTGAARAAAAVSRGCVWESM